MQQYKDLLTEEIYSNSKQMLLILQKKTVWLHVLSNCRVASHASFISFKQITIEGARRGLSRCQQFTALRDESEVLIPTEEFVVDLGLCLLKEKPTVPFSVTSHRCIPVKNTLD